MNKNLTLIALLVFFVVNYNPVTAQSLFKVPEEEKIQHASLIVEGKVTAQYSFWNTQHTMIYTSNKIEVYKIFKGTLSTDYVEIMTVGGSVSDENITASDLLTLEKGETGVFFCFPNPINLRSPVSSEPLFDVWSSAQGCYKYNLDKQTVSAPFIQYESITDQLYTTLQVKTGRKFENKNPAIDIKKITTGNKLTAVNISSFSPASVIAGAYALPGENTLTIYGSGFGTASGAAGINFDNPDDGTGGTPLFVAAASELVISWTDTQIDVKVPSKVGTGTFSVVDAGGGSASSPTNLEVKYAVLNGTFGSSPINRQYSLMNLNGSGGYNYLYCTSTANSGVDFSTAAQEAPFSRAITTWKEIAGLNFSYAGTTTTQTVNAGDGINIIMMDNTATGVSPLAAGVLAVCYSAGSSCSGNSFVRRAGFDIVVRNAGVSLGSTNFNNGPCKTSTSIAEYDMESVMLHELGHALNLGHINDNFIGSWPNVDPGKLMNYAIVNGVDRRSPDWSAYTGSLYNINPKSLSYGGCTAQTEMVPLSTTIESKDDCPGTFPSSPTPTNTLIGFDLNHATSNKFNDPQHTAVNTSAVGTGITNNAFYAIKTGSSGSGNLDINVSGYTTIPSSQSACSGAGIELSLYQAGSCPAAKAYPAPVAYRTFNGNGSLSPITGLAANTNYLIMVDGISNTKATFDLLLNGSVLPVSIQSFNGQKLNDKVKLTWVISNEMNNDHFEIETSKDGNSFYKIGEVKSHGNSSTTENYSFTDEVPAPGTNYYRLRQVDIDNRQSFSSTIAVNFKKSNDFIFIYPNPAKDNLTISFAGPVSKAVINILTVEGKLMKNVTTGSIQNNYILNLSAFPPGMYLIDIITISEKQTLRFIKK